MNKTIVALFSQNTNAASETFIKAHRDFIDADVRYYTDGLLPTKLDDVPLMRFKYQLKYFLSKKIHKKNLFSLNEFALLKSLQIEKPNIILCEYGNSAATSLGVIQYLNIPLIVYFHGYDISTKSMLEQYDNYKAVIKYAKSIFVVSREQKEKLIKFGAKPDSVIYNPCAPNDIFFSVKRNPKKYIFLAAGRFVDKKAPHLTLLAFKKLLKSYPEAKLIMAGDGELRQVVSDLIKYYQMQDNVELPGAYNRDQLIGWMSKATAFVQHSITAINGNQEGTPVVVLEAMAAGVPVISTKHAGIKDIIKDGETGYLVEEHDVDGMSKKMVKVIQDSKSVKLVTENGRKYVMDNLTMPKHIEKIDNAIGSIIQ